MLNNSLTTYLDVPVDAFDPMLSSTSTAHGSSSLVGLPESSVYKKIIYFNDKYTADIYKRRIGALVRCPIIDYMT